MARASIVKELLVKTENKVGMLAEVAVAIANSGVNIKALNAFAINNEAIFRIVTSDNMKAVKEIKAKNLEALEKDVVAVELENTERFISRMVLLGKALTAVEMWKISRMVS